ncbi:MAG: hypothetical protein ABWZ40_11275 [Caulobacterales bacterium]
MAKGRYKTIAHQVVVDYGAQTASMCERDYRETGYTPVYEDLPTESQWFAKHPEQMPLNDPELDEASAQIRH